MNATLSEFDWDDGNRAKCQKHGVSPAQIEALFDRPVLVIPDEAHSQDERRLRAIGRTARGRSVFLVFAVRERGGKRLIRPITARFMHRKEVRSYEKQNPDL